MKNEVIIKEHYVPQGYLRNFTFNKERDKIFCFNKRTDKHFDINIKNIAYEPNFYELPEPLQTKFEQEMGYSDRNSNEKYFKMFEDEAYPVIDNMIALSEKRDYPRLKELILSENTRLWLGTYIILQKYRTKLARNNLYDELYALGLSLMGDRRFLHPIQRFENEVLNASILKQMINFLDLPEINIKLNEIGNFDWSVRENTSDVPLVTSDNPVIEFEMLVDGKYISTWVLPLNSRLCLFIIHRYQTLHNNELPIFELEAHDVCQLNFDQLNQSNMFVFCNKVISQDLFQM